MLSARITSHLLAVVAIFCLCQKVNAWQIFMSPSGNDSNPGSVEKPIKSFGKAIELLKQAKIKTVILRGGVYRLDRPIQIDASCNGTENNPVVFKAFPGEAPVISGSKKLNLVWEKWKEGILVSNVPTGSKFETLFVNKIPQILARYPNKRKDVYPFGGYAADAVSKNRVALWKEPSGGYLHTLHGARWGGYHFKITGKNSNGNVNLEGGWQNNRPERPAHKTFRFVENVFEELDAEKEWYLNREEGKLYWKAENNLDPKKALFEVSHLEHLVEMAGTLADPVKHIQFQGIRFRHTKRTFMKSKEQLLRSDWGFYRSAAVWMKNCRSCKVMNCDFQHLGGNAILVDGHGRNIQISGNEISRIGGSAISFVGKPTAVRSPSFHYSQFTPLEKLDLAVGPKSEEYPADCSAEDNLIYEIGEIEKQTAGVQIAMAARIRVAHNSIYDVPRAGINVGDGTWGGHIIEFNDVFDTVKETSDHGSFNSWGRDRYWSSSAARVNSYVKKHPQLPLLDAVETTHIRNNRFRCDHGWDIDLDDGSTNYQIYNNLCLKNGIKLREGYFRHVFNNVVVNNSVHVHVWYESSGDVIQHNILGSWYFPIRMPRTWGRSINHNLFDIGERPSSWQKGNRDKDSVIINPEFVDPSKGDYRIKHSSPAWQIGFHNFAMNRFGVTSPRLRKKARTPKLPKYNAGLKVGQKPARDAKTYPWLGGKVKNLVGLGEVSATGMSKETGVLVVAAPKKSDFAKMGFKEGDVIFEFWGSPVENLNSLKRHYESRPKLSKIPITVMRNQAKLIIHID